MNFSVIAIIFFIINFGTLAIGSWLMGNGPQGDWYLSLNKAPWTPPGWVFGAAWTTIMICFSIYMTQLYINDKSGIIIVLFLFQLLLNVSWNYVFFNQHKVAMALLIITLLTLLVLYLLISYYSKLKVMSLLIVPYFLWLLIATSLNYYIYTNNKIL